MQVLCCIGFQVGNHKCINFTGKLLCHALSPRRIPLESDKMFHAKTGLGSSLDTQVFFCKREEENQQTKYIKFQDVVRWKKNKTDKRMKER